RARRAKEAFGDRDVVVEQAQRGWCRENRPLEVEPKYSRLGHHPLGDREISCLVLILEPFRVREQKCADGDKRQDGNGRDEKSKLPRCCCVGGCKSEES